MNITPETTATGVCPYCDRTVTLVNARYPQITTRLRAHYPKPYSWYADHSQPLPATYCPGSAHTPKGQT